MRARRRRTASRRLATPRRRQALEICLSTVLGARPTARAISLVWRWRMTSSIQVRSAGVSWSRGSVMVRAGAAPASSSTGRGSLWL
jgi:hypothetical protein